MTETSGDRRARIAEVSAAIGLLTWRAAVLPLPGLFRDWIVLLSVYWIFTVFGSRTRAWPYVTGGVMVLLAILYLQGQGPHTLASLGIAW